MRINTWWTRTVLEPLTLGPTPVQGTKAFLAFVDGHHRTQGVRLIVLVYASVLQTLRTAHAFLLLELETVGVPDAVHYGAGDTT